MNAAYRRVDWKNSTGRRERGGTQTPGLATQATRGQRCLLLPALWKQWRGACQQHRCGKLPSARRRTGRHQPASVPRHWLTHGPRMASKEGCGGGASMRALEVCILPRRHAAACIGGRVIWLTTRIELAAGLCLIN
eukprot:363329-Chlamydomonas_euryale.AAC.8